MAENKVKYSEMFNPKNIISDCSNSYQSAISALGTYSAHTYLDEHACANAFCAPQFVIKQSDIDAINNATKTKKVEKPSVTINEQLEAAFAFKLGELDIKRVIFSDPCTIILWKDGTKTVVRVHEDEKFNPYYGFCAAVVKKMFGSNSKLNKFVDQWIAKNEASKK